MSTSNTTQTEEFRSHEFFVTQAREARHSDNQHLRGLTRRASNGDFADVNDLFADLPRRRPPKHHASEKVRRYGRNKSSLARSHQWLRKTKSWKRRSAEAATRARAYEELREHGLGLASMDWVKP